MEHHPTDALTDDDGVTHVHLAQYRHFHIWEAVEIV